MAYFEDGKCEDARLQELLIIPIESYIKDCPDRVLICKKSMRLQQEVCFPLENDEEPLPVSSGTSDLEQKIIADLHSVKIQIRNCCQNLTTF